MKKITYPILLLLCLLASCSKDEMLLLLETPEQTEYLIDRDGQEFNIPVASNAAWAVSTDAEWLTTNRVEGTGDGIVTVRINANPIPERRYASVNIRLKGSDKMFAVKVVQNGASRLLGLPSIEKGAGYSYDVSADYCTGMLYQVFDIIHMDYKQMLNGKFYVMDDNEAMVEEEFVMGKTEEEISQQISANASIGLDLVKVFQAGLTGSVDYSKLEAKSTQFAMSRTKRIIYSRDIQYRNVLADVMAGDKELFAAGFYVDWKKLQDMNESSGRIDEQAVTRFLKKWGPCFVSRSCLGGSIDYEMEIDKSVLSESLTIELAAEASLAGIIEADAGGKYTETMKKIKEHYRKYVHVKGGDVQAISILNSGGSISQAGYRKWLESINYDRMIAGNANVALIDVKLVAFSELFTGKVREEVRRQIDKWNEIK
ncbi:MAC/perforin domain-containing protein [uncultured Bacteroides sp.]|uniref:MAC/perforin domain-containing protein n=1 Tax=uncultured Bacteroides sp. TaxID=162156 RepID=UPI002612D7FB|nr:MAC/perforin domain-containing protein [uncultured Bacteroides sp.]